MTRLLGVLVALLLTNSASANVLEVPADGGEASGIGFFAGWKCPPNDDITLVIDGGSPIPAATGIRRGDTASVCGNDGSNGYISEFNFSQLADGEHAVSVREGGQAFASATFHVTTFGTPFMRGASGTYTLQNFPSAGASATIEWSEGAQNFLVVGKSGGVPTPTPTPKPTATPTHDAGTLADLIGTWSFTYTIVSTFTETLHLQSINTVDGVQEIDGFDDAGNLVTGGALHDVFPASSSTLDWALLDKGTTMCQAFLFDRSGDTASGSYATASIVNGNCGTFVGAYSSTGVRTSQTATVAGGTNQHLAERAGRRMERLRRVEATEAARLGGAGARVAPSPLGEISPRLQRRSDATMP